MTADTVERLIGRIGSDFDGECHLTEDEAREVVAEIEKLRRERDNLEMAYRHAQRCFHGAVRSTDPNRQAERDVERAIAGCGPRAALQPGDASQGGEDA